MVETADILRKRNYNVITSPWHSINDANESYISKDNIEPALKCLTAGLRWLLDCKSSDKRKLPGKKPVGLVIPVLRLNTVSSSSTRHSGADDSWIWVTFTLSEAWTRTGLYMVLFFIVLKFNLSIWFDNLSYVIR